MRMRTLTCISIHYYKVNLYDEILYKKTKTEHSRVIHWVNFCCWLFLFFSAALKSNKSMGKPNAKSSKGNPEITDSVADDRQQTDWNTDNLSAKEKEKKNTHPHIDIRHKIQNIPKAKWYAS